MVLVLVIIILFPNIISVVFSILQLHNKIIFLFSLDILSSLLCSAILTYNINKSKYILAAILCKLRIKYLRRGRNISLFWYKNISCQFERLHSADVSDNQSNILQSAVFIFIKIQYPNNFLQSFLLASYHQSWMVCLICKV